MTGPDTGNGRPAPSATPTSGALTKAGLRLQAKERKAQLATAARAAPGNTTRGKPGPKTPRKLPSAQDLERIAWHRAGGARTGDIAKLIRVSDNAVRVALKDPEVLGQIAIIRERLRGTQIASANAIAQKAWEAAEGSLDERDAKSFDAYTRGIHAMEKVAASASGEDRKVEVTHQGMIPTEPIRIQLQQLIALVRNEST